MGFSDTMPFLRGETYFGIGGKPDDDVSDNLVGREYLHQDNTYGTGCLVKVRVCRNASGIKLLAGKLVAFCVAPGRVLNANAIRYATNGFREPSAVVDDLLKYQVPKGDLFYAVISGPCLAYPINDDIPVGGYLHAGYGGDPRSTNPLDECGRVQKANFDYDGSDMACAIGHVVGRAMSAVTKGKTYRDRILIQAGFGAWQ